jgi:hypothetical protein
MIFFKSLLSILFTILLLSFSTSNSFTDFSGKWHAKTVTAFFDLKLTQIKGRVSGSHCAIQLGGARWTVYWMIKMLLLQGRPTIQLQC